MHGLIRCINRDELLSEIGRGRDRNVAAGKRKLGLIGGGVGRVGVGELSCLKDRPEDGSISQKQNG